MTAIRAVAWVLALLLPVGATGLGAAPHSGRGTPAASSCEIEGEGSLSTNPEASFDLEAEHEPGRNEPEGELSYRDTRVGLRFRSSRIASLVVRGTRGTVRGMGQVDGADIEFTIEVEDRTPDQRPDRFQIQLSSGYAAAGDVSKGGVEIECEEEGEEGEEGLSAEHRAGRDGLLRQLGRDFRHLADRDNLLVLAGGGAASLAVRNNDRGITNAFESSPALDLFLEPGAVGGGGLVQVGGAVATYVVGRATRNGEVRALGYHLIRAQIVSGVLTQGLKLAAGRTRPDGSNRLSFPSGHSSASFATATVLQRFYGWKVGLPAYVFAVYVAGSRLQENKHFPSDVLFGAALGIVGGRSVTVGRGRARVALVPLAVPDGGFGVALVGGWR